jgi:hypothetical protein
MRMLFPMDPSLSCWNGQPVWEDEIEKLFQDPGGHSPDFILTPGKKKDWMVSPLPGPVFSPKVLRPEQIGQGDIDSLIDLLGIKLEGIIFRIYPDIGGDQIAMHGVDIVKAAEQFHVLRLDTYFFPGFSQGRGQQIGIFGLADATRKGKFPAVVVQVWGTSGNQQIEAACSWRERQQDRGRSGSWRQGTRVVLGQRCPDPGLQFGCFVQINGSLARFFSSAMVAV